MSRTVPVLIYGLQGFHEQAEYVCRRERTFDPMQTCCRFATTYSGRQRIRGFKPTGSLGRLYCDPVPVPRPIEP